MNLIPFQTSKEIFKIFYEYSLPEQTVLMKAIHDFQVTVPGACQILLNYGLTLSSNPRTDLYNRNNLYLTI